VKGLRRLSWDERGIRLARRLGFEPPPSPSATQLIRMWALIGMELAEKEPEFGWGGGRRIGSANKKLAHTDNPKTLYKRKKRAAGRKPS
jgi:hypothetical protein